MHTLKKGATYICSCSRWRNGVIWFVSRVATVWLCLYVCFSNGFAVCIRLWSGGEASDTDWERHKDSKTQQENRDQRRTKSELPLEQLPRFQCNPCSKSTGGASFSIQTYSLLLSNHAVALLHLHKHRLADNSANDTILYWTGNKRRPIMGLFH